MRLLKMLTAIEAAGVKMQIDSFPQENIFCETTSAVEAHEAIEAIQLAVLLVGEEFAIIDASQPENWLIDCSEGFQYAD